MKLRLRGPFITACLLTLTACSDETGSKARPPDVLSRDDTGYFCGMIVEDHTGPKSQIRLAGSGETLWFTSVRDGIAFTLLPEETRAISAFYVSSVDNDSWDHPESAQANWLPASSAWYVIKSDRRGGMGAAEAIPFATEAAARQFADQHDGQVAGLADIPVSYILGPDS